MIGLACVLSFCAAYAFGVFIGAGRVRGGDGQDRKFAFRNGHFVNRVSGEAIPPDEPVIIFRARDRHALPVLGYYFGLVEDPHHLAVIRERIGDFQRYRDEHPERMKEPGVTHDYRLRDGCGWLGCEEYDAVRFRGCHGAPRELQLGKHMEVEPAAEAPPLRDCPYAHPVGTRCPNCAKWPYPKQEGGNVR